MTSPTLPARLASPASWAVPAPSISPLLALAEDDYDAGTEHLPADVPVSWTGSIAESCRLSLDDAVTLVQGVSSLLSTAQDAAAALEALGEPDQGAPAPQGEL